MTLRFINTPDANATFYSTFPSFGKNLAFQWEELRQDLQLLNPLVRATEYDNQSSKPLQDSAVTASEYGEFDFHNKYRIRWVKSSGQLEVQKNTGTEAAPTWAVHTTFGEDVDGNLILKDVHGVVSQVSETGAGGDTSFYNVSELLFDVGSGFYLTSSRDGHPVVSFTQLFGRADSFAQTDSAIEWTINHNFNSTKLSVQVFDDNHQMITPTSYQTTRVNVPNAAAEWVVNHNLGTRNVLCEAFDEDGGIRLTDQPMLKRMVVQNENQVNFYFDTSRRGFALINGIVDGVDRIDISDKDTAHFYFSSLRKGSVFISSGASGAVELLTALTFTDEINAHTSTTLVFANNQFYLDTNALGQPKLNLSSGADAAAITGANLGAGQGVFAQKTGSTLEFKSLAAGTNISLSSTSSEITINSEQARFYGVVFKLSDDSFIEKDDTLVFDSTDFSMSTIGGKPNVSVTAVAGMSIIFKDGVNSITSNTLNVNSTDFYFSTNLSGQAVLNLLSASSSTIIFKDGVNENTSGTFNVSAGDFYLSTNLSGQPVLNLLAASVSSITFEETEAGGFSKAGDTLAFFSTDFYLSTGGDGNTIVSLVSAGGGPGGTTITFRESESGGYSKADDTLTFDSKRFYLTTGGYAKTLVSLVGPVSEFFASAVEWQFTHNLDSTAVIWSAYDDGNRAVIPSVVDVSNPNIAFFYFSEAVAGTGVIFG